MVEIELTINLEGEYTQEQIDQSMFILGELVINKIKQNIRNMRLISDGGGQLLQGWFAKYTGNTLVIENTQPYMIYLEYGTYEYFDIYGRNNYPTRMDPKKKDIPADIARLFPKGMQPFAFVRKVLYNDIVMQDLVNRAFG